jgi:tetratricopeptide (TPR) repeat protein
MNLTDNLPKLQGAPGGASDERALLHSRRAAELIFEGRYEEARRELGAFWQGVGRRPRLDGLGESAAAEVLMQCGALSARFGSTRGVAAAQEAAKDLLSEALRIFETAGPAAKVSEAKYELGGCYWRLGALEEARLLLAEALRGLGPADSELKAKILIRQTLVEVSAYRYHDAWGVLKEAEPVFEAVGDALKGKWHAQKALVLMQLAGAAGGGDYTDRAIIEFTAAIHHLCQAGLEQFCGASLNNLAFLLYRQGRYEEAHLQLDRARRIFTRLRDPGVISQIDETRARVLTAEGRHAEAEAVIKGAVRALREGGGRALLADALVVRGVVEARRGKFSESISTLREAVVAAETAGSPESAGRAALTLVEEHARERLSEEEAYEAYRRADDLLARTQDAGDIARLRACARLVLDRCAAVELGEGFLLPRAVRAHEARFIKKALLLEDGSISRAAKRLGVKHSRSRTRSARGTKNSTASARPPSRAAAASFARATTRDTRPPPRPRAPPAPRRSTQPAPSRSSTWRTTGWSRTL